MAGYELAEGRYENRTLSDDEMWSAFSNLFSSHSKNSSSYKFGFLKAIMDNLYNVDQNLTLTFDQLFGTFTEVYWNLVLKHGIRQQPVSERSNGTYLEQALNITAVKYAITAEIPFESISDEAKIEVCKKIKRIDIRPLVIEAPEEYKEYDVIFNEYRDTVIQGIRDAKFIIWVAVAWFSDTAIYQELLVKKDKGLNIRIILSKEESNNSTVSMLKRDGFDYKVIEHWGNRGYNRMHHKFCIIDMDYVMHGSYNWTPTANNNNETLATALDHELVSKFASEFMLMYNE